MTFKQWSIFALCVLFLGTGLVLYQTRVRDPFEGHLCLRWYQSATTPAESSLVDGRFPPLARGRGEYTGPIPTCGELRRLGHVRNEFFFSAPRG